MWLQQLLYKRVSLVPRLSAQLFFARKSWAESLGKKKLGREPGNEATRELHVPSNGKHN